MTVELVDGSRRVRGRAAQGEERERLWARWGDISTRTSTPTRRDEQRRRPSSSSSRNTEEKRRCNDGNTRPRISRSCSAPSQSWTGLVRRLGSRRPRLDVGCRGAVRAPGRAPKTPAWRLRATVHVSSRRNRSVQLTSSAGSHDRKLLNGLLSSTGRRRMCPRDPFTRSVARLWVVQRLVGGGGFVFGGRGISIGVFGASVLPPAERQHRARLHRGNKCPGRGADHLGERAGCRAAGVKPRRAPISPPGARRGCTPANRHRSCLAGTRRHAMASVSAA